MNKKDLKFYEAPVLEVVELEANAVLLAGSTQSSAEDVSTETGGDEI